jgi:DNA-binding beta-propeller fold protein YncE
MTTPTAQLRFVRVLAFSSVLFAPLVATTPALAASPFTLFESGQVRPLALSPDGKLLFAANTPDNRLEVFRVKANGLHHRASVPVGLEPVAVAARSDHEVWVVNHLSDSVSIVHLSHGGDAGEVVRTLLLGDEPRDIVFGGPGRSRAFITTAHRGQNHPIDPQLLTHSVGRADVWVFDADHLGPSLAGDPLTIETLYTDTPRALAVTPDGSRVYAAGFHTGNRTTTVGQEVVPNGGQAAGGVLDPATNADGVPRPEAGLIVQFTGTHWLDGIGRLWDDKVNFYLPDKDVFVIDAMANPPAVLPGASGFFSRVGTVLFNMTVNPVSGKVYVSNTDANNMERFEGAGTFSGETARGHLHESRITILSSAGVTPRHLNKHIDYTTCCAPLPNAENAKSLAQPQEMAVTSDGKTLYVAALGSSKIGVFKTAALENNTFVPSTANQIAVTGGGPTGLVIDAHDKRLYTLTRFDNSISVINAQTRTEIAHVAMPNPEPPSIVQGRRFLYDASFSSSHGDSSCASCHIFGDFDSLAWELGDPDEPVLNHPGPFISFPFPVPAPDPFHPVKGPMVTQSLRGMANHGAMHWRGDRTGGNDAPTAQPDSGTFDERAAFRKFNVGFTGLLGRHAEISAADLEAFGDFILQVTYPPNPIRALDNVLTPQQQQGSDHFFGGPSDSAGVNCAGCHPTDPDGNPGSDAPGFFGADGTAVFDFQPQFTKVPHLRNLYQKVGMFGLVPSGQFTAGDFTHKGDQIRGFGYTHDGSIDSTFQFLNALGFDQNPGNPGGIPVGAPGDALRTSVATFVLAFDSNMKPIMGQQVTLTSSHAAVAGPRIDLLMARAELGECDLVAKARVANLELGFLYIGAGQFIMSWSIVPVIGDSAVRALALSAHRPVTYTCTPPGSGERIGVDRDGDGSFDGDELFAGTDPADPQSHP